jgi:hypothetical protein
LPPESLIGSSPIPNRKGDPVQPPGGGTLNHENDVLTQGNEGNKERKTS